MCLMDHHAALAGHMMAPTCSIPACCRDSMQGCRVCYDLGGGLLEGVLAQALAAATGVKGECSLLVGHAPLVTLL